MPQGLRALWSLAKGDRERRGARASERVAGVAHSPTQGWTCRGTKAGVAKQGKRGPSACDRLKRDDRRFRWQGKPWTAFATSLALSSIPISVHLSEKKINGSMVGLSAALRAGGDMKYYQKPLAKIIPSGDYIHVVCEKCGEACEVDYKGLDPSVPLLEIRCPKCGDLGTWKLWQFGMGFLQHTKT